MENKKNECKNKRFIPEHCKHCLGECPENCELCIYSSCRKPVDEKLVTYKWNRYLIYWNDKEFWTWFQQYFRIGR